MEEFYCPVLSSSCSSSKSDNVQDITKDIAREMRETAPDIRWRRVPFNEKCSIMERVNSLLSKEGIPAVEIDLVGWRMSRAIGNLKHSEG